jgi:hypothetical protein
VTTQVAEQSTAPGIGRGPRSSHYFCPGCALITGGHRIRALCGYTTRLHRVPLSQRTLNDGPPPANACVVCRELYRTHPSDCPKETP